MSTVLGVIAAIGLWVGLYLSYQNAGAPSEGYGAAAFLALVFSVIGIILAVIGYMQQDRFRLFSNLGMILNVFNLVVISVILNTAAYM